MPTQHSPETEKHSIDQIKRINIFKDVPDEVLRTFKDRIAFLNFYREDEILKYLDATKSVNNFYFILSGQAKIHCLDDLGNPKIINFLKEGEFFVDRIFSWGKHRVYNIVTIVDSLIIKVPKSLLIEACNYHMSIYHRMNAISDAIDQRYKMFSDDPKKEAILKFLVENELTYARTVKVSLLDRCIDCDACYEACNSRFGNIRLTRHVKRLGLIDLVTVCRNCIYPHCIEVCKYDSIKYNPNTEKIEMLGTCIGCGACAKACPFDAIKLLEYEEETSDSRVRIKKMADKCDHCQHFENEACIINCPTGAMQNVEVMDLVSSYEIFGLAHKKLSKEKIKKLKSNDEKDEYIQPIGKRNAFEKVLLFFQIMLGIIILASLGNEFLFRSINMDLTISKQLLNFGILNNKSFEFIHSGEFIHILGSIGAFFAILALIYPIHEMFPKFSKILGTAISWFDFHIFVGIMCIILIAFHSSFNLTGIIPILLLVCLLLIFISGLLGRYIYVSIPKGMAGIELEQDDLEKEDQDLTRKIEIFFSDDPNSKEIIAKITGVLNLEFPTISTQVDSFFDLAKFIYKLITGTILLIINDLVRKIRINKLSYFIPEELQLHKYQMKEFIKIINQKAILKRNIALLSTLKEFSFAWYWVHKPASYFMFYLLAFHVVVAIIFYSK